MKNILLTLLGLLSSFSAYAQCQTGNVYADIACYEKKLKEDKKELNKIYNGFYASLDEEGKTTLNESQKAWIVYREKECNGLMAYFAPESQGGGPYLMTLSCTVTKTVERIKELKGYLE